MNNNRNFYLVIKAMKSFLWATILANVALSLVVLVDSLFVSNILGANAVSILTLFVPIGLIENVFTAFFHTGAFVLYSKYLGERNTQKIHNTFATAFVSIIVILIVLIAVFLLFGDAIFPLFCKEKAMLNDFRDYAIVNATLTYFLTTIIFFLGSIMSIEGKPKVTIYAIVILLVVNTICDYVLLGICHFGIASAAYSTAIGSLCSLLYLLKYVVKDYGHILTKLMPNFSMQALFDNAKQAIPKCSLFACTAISLLIFNLYIQREIGENGLFVWSISWNLFSLSHRIVSSIGMACLTLGLFYKGHRDTKGLSFIFRRSNICVASVILFVMGLLYFLPGSLASIFGATSAELIEYSKTCLRYCAILTPGFLLTYYMSNIFQLNNKLVLSSLCLIFYPLVLIVVSLFSSRFDTPWMLYPITGIILFVLVMGSYLLSKRKKERVDEVQHSLDVSIKADTESFKDSLQEFGDSLKNLGLDHLLVFRINVCVEEVMINIVQNSGANMANHFFDIHIAVLDKKVICSIKDDSINFNPIHIPEDKRGMGLQIIFGLCPNIEYQYMYGQNMTYLSWDKD